MDEVNQCLTIFHRKIHYLFTQCLYNRDVRAIHTVNEAHLTTLMKFPTPMDFRIVMEQPLVLSHLILSTMPLPSY